MKIPKQTLRKIGIIPLHGIKEGKNIRSAVIDCSDCKNDIELEELLRQLANMAYAQGVRDALYKTEIALGSLINDANPNTL